jgi:exo-1,4-beta-D-glucosaminidase
MFDRRARNLALLASAGLIVAGVVGGVHLADPGRITSVVTTFSLDRGWNVASSADVNQAAPDVSSVGFDVGGWTPTIVPSTIVGALASHGDVADPYTGTNITSIPERAFSVPWWYRTTFSLGVAPNGTRTELHLDGVNYRADVWVNGRLVAGADRVVGTFRRFSLDVTGFVHPGVNALAIEVQPVDPKHDLTVTWIDWNPMPPDHGMGLWQPVWISRSGGVTITDPRVAADLPLPDTSSADITVSATVTNTSASRVTTVVKGTIKGLASFDASVDVAAGASQVVTFSPPSVPALHVADPPIWWPYGMGSQPVEDLTMTASVAGLLSDTAHTTFGIREVSADKTARHHLRFQVNGRPLLVLGAGWASDMLLRPTPGRVDEQLGYVRDLGLNTVRLEGKLESDHFFDRADRLGIMVLPGWMCCDRWQKNSKWSTEDYAIAGESMYDQAIRLRNHPSVLAYAVGSDRSPPHDIATMYADALSRAGWPLPVLASASQGGAAPFGPTGVKMTGPYDWVPPGYWYDPKGQGAAFGFNTETSTGASIPELESLRRFMRPEELRALWTEPTTPQAHAGTGESVFNNFRIFDRAMSARLGAPTSLADYVEKSQVLQYEGERAMFEAFSANRYRSTGVIQWMLNNGWPSLHWNLFDWYLEPNGSYFGAKEALRSLHVLYRYDNGSVDVVDRGWQDVAGARVTARVYALDGKLLGERHATVDVPRDGVVRALTHLTGADRNRTYFLQLTLAYASGATIDTNTYWLARDMDHSAFSRSHWFVTPTSSYADLRALERLPVTHVVSSACVSNGPQEQMSTRVRVTNPTNHIAFFVRLRLSMRGTDIAPVAWTDNDLTLPPGASRTVTASYRADGEGDPRISVTGWNVASSAAVTSCA